MPNKTWKSKTNTATYLLIVSFVLAACGPKKFVAEEGLTAKNAKAAVAIHESLRPEFKTLNGKIRATYQDDDTRQSLSITYRIEKDKTIWMSAKAAGLFTVAKLMVTPNRVQFFEKIGGQYFDGDFSLISQILGVEIDFEALQNMLFAQSVYPLKATKSNAKAVDSNFIFTHQINSFLEQEASISTRNFTLGQQIVRHSNQTDFMSVNYPTFQELNKSPFPKEIDILAKRKDKTVNLKIEYRDIRVDEELSFPFKIPSNYDEIIF